LNWDRIEKELEAFKVNAISAGKSSASSSSIPSPAGAASLAGRIQKTCGMTREDTERQLADWRLASRHE